jgi:hypothetical protein
VLHDEWDGHGSSSTHDKRAKLSSKSLTFADDNEIFLCRPPGHLRRPEILATYNNANEYSEIKSSYQTTIFMDGDWRKMLEDIHTSRGPRIPNARWRLGKIRESTTLTMLFLTNKIGNESGPRWRKDSVYLFRAFNQMQWCGSREGEERRRLGKEALAVDNAKKGEIQIQKTVLELTRS